MKLILQSIRQTIVWSVIAGVIYPLVFTVFAQLVFPNQANGSLVTRDGKLVGSEWMAQQFQGAKYFWPRPSAASYGTGATGLNAGSGSNLGPTSAQLQTNVRANAKALRDAGKLAADAPVPADLVYASASGVDPHISPEAAEFQVARVAAARGMPADRVRSIVDEHVEAPQLGFLGQARVNVLLLNLALDAADTKKSG
jgi:potassium-transporting ATPase KdpC subunit